MRDQGGKGTRFRTSWRFEEGRHWPSFEAWTDSVRGESARASGQEPRGGVETIGGESCLGEHRAFDIARHALSKYPVRAV